MRWRAPRRFFWRWNEVEGMSGGERGHLVVRVARSALAAVFFTGFAAGSVALGFLLFPVLLVAGRGENGRRLL